MYGWKLIISHNVQKYLDKLDVNMHERIINKLRYYASLPDPKVYAERLTNFDAGTYKYRIGDYRVIVDFDDKGRLIVVAIIGHRREIYT